MEKQAQAELQLLKGAPSLEKVEHFTKLLASALAENDGNKAIASLSGLLINSQGLPKGFDRKWLVEVARLAAKSDVAPVMVEIYSRSLAGHMVEDKVNSKFHHREREAMYTFLDKIQFDLDEDQGREKFIIFTRTIDSIMTENEMESHKDPFCRKLVEDLPGTDQDQVRRKSTLLTYALSVQSTSMVNAMCYKLIEISVSGVSGAISALSHIINSQSVGAEIKNSLKEAAFSFGYEDDAYFFSISRDAFKNNRNVIKEIHNHITSEPEYAKGLAFHIAEPEDLEFLKIAGIDIEKHIGFENLPNKARSAHLMSDFSL